MGYVSCDDVRAMQKQINSYRSDLGTSIDLLKSPGLFNKDSGKWESHELGNLGPRSVLAWRDLGDRCSQFEEESCYVGVFAGTQYDRGRKLLTELDGWRDYLSSISAPSLPDPVEVPKSDVSILSAAGGVMPLLLIVGAAFLLHEAR